MVHPFARLAEILALRRTAANLLDTYVGRNSGERILAGTSTAVTWKRFARSSGFPISRGFTELSGSSARAKSSTR